MSISTKTSFIGKKSLRPIRIMVLGQSSVGKSALVVRFITKRYIGEYDPTLEKIYAYQTLIDQDLVNFEILDTAGQPNDSESPTLQANIRWAEAFILMYSVIDKCSFDECNRFKFLINYNKRRRRLTYLKNDAPVILVGNKNDLTGDRMVSFEEGRRRSVEIGCVSFHEISVRESIEEVFDVFKDLVSNVKGLAKYPRIKRSKSEIPPMTLEEKLLSSSSKHETDDDSEEPFRNRASTDGSLQIMVSRLRINRPLHNRRMSISMRGTF